MPPLLLQQQQHSARVLYTRAYHLHVTRVAEVAYPGAPEIDTLFVCMCVCMCVHSQFSKCIIIVVIAIIIAQMRAPCGGLFSAQQFPLRHSASVHCNLMTECRDNGSTLYDIYDSIYLNIFYAII